MPEVWHRIFDEALLRLKYLSEQHYDHESGFFVGAAYSPSNIALLRTAPLSALVASRA